MLITPTKHYFRRYASFFTLLLLNAACTDHEPRPETEPLPIAAVNERLLLESTSFVGVKDIEYNADKTPKKYEITNYTQDVEVAYTANKATYVFSDGGKIVRKKVYELKNGIAQKLTEYEVDQNGTEEEDEVTTYLYKAGKLHKMMISKNGQLIRYSEYFYDVSNENVSMIEDYDKDGLLGQRRNFEYSNIPDKSGSYNDWNLNMEGTLFPKYSKYLVKKWISEANGSTKESTFTYVLDQQGYVTAGQITTVNGTSDWTNTWQ